MPKKAKRRSLRPPGPLARRAGATRRPPGRAAEILLESMCQFVGLLAPDGVLLTANRASLDAVRSREGDVIGLPFWETPWWRELPAAQAQLRGAVREAARGAFVRYEVEHRGRGGAGLVAVDFSLTPVRDGAGRVVHLVAEGRDVTDRKRADAELARRQAELEALNARLARADELKTAFFANVSHELRTPLALVLGPLEGVLAAPTLAPEAREALEMARRNARLLLKHVNDLLEVTRIDAGRAEVRRARVDLADLVRVTAAHFDGVARERGMSFAVETPGSFPASLDAEKIERVLLNLLANAFKFAPAGGTVRCALREEEGRAVLTIEDSGPGVPAAERDAIFQRFFQAGEGPTRRHGGTGLGLAIAREFVTLHDGVLRVGDAPGGGAAFTVELPAGAPAGAAVARGEVVRGGALERLDGPELTLETVRGAPPAPQSAGRPGQPLVLVVDDDPEMRRFISDTLARRFRIATAADAATALALAAELRPDLVLTDVMMPGLGGDELVRRLRRSDATRDVPVVLLTALTEDALRIRLIEEGALDYLTKPFSPRELVARVANLVALRRVQQALQRHLETRENDVEQLTVEIVLRNRELKVALETAHLERDRAEEASRAKSDFLALVSHELLTPISAARLSCELLERDPRHPLSPAQATLVHRTVGAVGRLGTTVQSLLQHVRIESGRLEPRRERVDLAALAAEVADELRPAARRKGLELRVVAEPRLRPARTDERLLRLVLANLAGNAVKFTMEGSVRLGVSCQRDGHRIVVQDSGPGIRPEDRARVFEPFQHGEPVSHKHEPGIGLGLALARQMAAVLGATLDLEPHDGPGSTFVLTLPETGADAPSLGAT